MASEQVIQAGKIWREDLDNRISTGKAKGDELMVNHGLIASANMSKLNINNLGFVLIFY